MARFLISGLKIDIPAVKLKESSPDDILEMYQAARINAQEAIKKIKAAEDQGAKDEM